MIPKREKWLLIRSISIAANGGLYEVRTLQLVGISRVGDCVPTERLFAFGGDLNH
jgi:hypothetical protein